MRAFLVVNCQSALVWLALRSCSQAAISSMRICLLGMRIRPPLTVALTAPRLRTLHCGLWCVVSTFPPEDIGSALKGGVKVCQRNLVREVLRAHATEFALNLAREDATPIKRAFHGG